MTYEEAKEYMEKKNRCSMDYESCKKYEDCKGCPNDVDLDLFPEVMEMAIEALEKKIPKKTKETSLGTECSVCGSIVKIRACAKFAYCPYCGKKIDW